MSLKPGPPAAVPRLIPFEPPFEGGLFIIANANSLQSLQSLAPCVICNFFSPLPAAVVCRVVRPTLSSLVPWWVSRAARDAGTPPEIYLAPGLRSLPPCVSSTLYYVVCAARPRQVSVRMAPSVTSATCRTRSARPTWTRCASRSCGTCHRSELICWCFLWSGRRCSRSRRAWGASAPSITWSVLVGMLGDTCRRGCPEQSAPWSTLCARWG